MVLLFYERFLVLEMNPPFLDMSSLPIFFKILLSFAKNHQIVLG